VNTSDLAYNPGSGSWLA